MVKLGGSLYAVNQILSYYEIVLYNRLHMLHSTI